MKPTINICLRVTLLLVSIIALGGVPDGKHRARDIHNTTGVSTAIGDCPFAGPKYSNRSYIWEIRIRNSERLNIEYWILNIEYWILDDKITHNNY